MRKPRARATAGADVRALRPLEAMRPAADEARLAERARARCARSGSALAARADRGCVLVGGHSGAGCAHRLALAGTSDSPGDPHAGTAEPPNARVRVDPRRSLFVTPE